MSRTSLLDMFMAVTSARKAAQEGDSESGQEETSPRSLVNDDVQPRRAARSRAQAPIATLEDWNAPLPTNSNPAKKTLPFLTSEAKQSTADDLWARAFSRPTSHPTGTRHPRVYTLIRQRNSVTSAHRGSFSTPAVTSRGVSSLRGSWPPQPPPSPHPMSQIGSTRHDRQTGQMTAKADSRRD
ncbi:hypothetical protein PGTUg99_008741 [Puccinia graminis f. sp. tritici]|uniref:Uncharacterized protein n=1 Tax=Puccinia graminis f. sp. tritici TaxID=56615 RepID=A0A5B0RVU2_PUCGR|nr:hypothetical protein PGTUg99_008741 [Puccinia graminis f. sp. tritici]